VERCNVAVHISMVTSVLFNGILTLARYFSRRVMKITISMIRKTYFLSKTTFAVNYNSNTRTIQYFVIF
jgi:hypothetical protein